MDAQQTIYYALGQLAYAVAMADGKVQKEEKDKFQKLILGCKEKYDIDFDYADIIFQILEKDNININTSYEWAIKEMNLCNYKLTEDLKEKFIQVITEVAAEYPPVTIDEMNIIQKFKSDLAKI